MLFICESSFYQIILIVIVTCRSCTGLFLSEWVSLGDPVTVARLDRWNVVVVVVVVVVIVVVVLGDRVGRGHSVTVRCLRNVCSFQERRRRAT